MTNLTELQLKLISFYRAYFKEHRRYPRLIEAVDYFKQFDPKVRHQYLSSRAKSLVNKGYMEEIYAGMYKLTRKK